ncbi:MAG: hypothetical protein PHU71_03665, partial [Candidatus Gracilibacteria bacterium]|nr:hypothetical protein [Candidatus Gracilibacteria bacterium]
YHRKHSGYGMNRLTPVQKMATTWFYSLNNLNLQKVTGTLQQHTFLFFNPFVLKWLPVQI